MTIQERVDQLNTKYSYTRRHAVIGFYWVGIAVVVLLIGAIVALVSENTTIAISLIGATVFQVVYIVYRYVRWLSM